MYRVTKRQRERLAATRAAKDRKRLDGAAPEPTRELPALRREVIVIDHDFGTVTHHFRMYRTSRIDCYRVTVDEKEWKRSIGWSEMLAGLRKSLPRVAAYRGGE